MKSVWVAKTPKNYIQEYCQYILRTVILIWSHTKAFICLATCWNINVRSTEDWHVGKLSIVFTDVRKRTSFTVIETAETRTSCPEMDFKRTVAYVHWTKLGDRGAIMEPPNLVNLHSLDPHLYCTTTGKGSCENTHTTKYKNQLSVPRNVDLCTC